MSILVRGMEMPEADYQPVMIDWVDGVVKDISQTKVLGEVVIIPTPHGRLVDADNLIELCDIMADKCDRIGQSIWEQYRAVVEDLPTIIEAEE